MGFCSVLLSFRDFDVMGIAYYGSHWFLSEIVIEDPMFSLFICAIVIGIAYCSHDTCIVPKNYCFLENINFVIVK